MALFSGNDLVLEIDDDSSIEAPPTPNTPRLGREFQRRRFCVGFAFNPHQSRVALIAKNREPEGADMIDTLNGIGGGVLQRETYEHGMQREFYQETGVIISSWRLFAIVDGPDYRLMCYTARLTRHEWRSIRTGENSVTDEQVGRYPVRQLPRTVYDDVRFLVPLALMREAVVRIDRRGI